MWSTVTVSVRMFLGVLHWHAVCVWRDDDAAEPVQLTRSGHLLLPVEEQLEADPAHLLSLAITEVKRATPD